MGGGGTQGTRFFGDGSTDSDNLGFIVRPAYGELFVQAFLNWFSQQRNWDLCRLRTMPSDSPTVQLLQLTVSQLGWVHDLSKHPSSAIILPESWDKYLAKLSSKERRK